MVVNKKAQVTDLRQRGGGKMPQVMDTGYETNEEKTAFTTVSGKKTVEAMKFYVYEPSLENSKLSQIKTDVWKPSFNGDRATSKNAYWAREGFFGRLMLYRK